MVTGAIWTGIRCQEERVKKPVKNSGRECLRPFSYISRWCEKVPIAGKLYAWGDKVKHVPEEAGVYAFYNKDRQPIYIGNSSNLQKTFTHFLETNFSNDPRKRGTTYYKREFSPKQEERVKELLDEYRQKYGSLPDCNLPPEPLEKESANEWGFYFYEDIGKPLYESAFNPQELKEKIEKVPVASLEFHQKRGDFAKWLGSVFKEASLAEAVKNLETTGEALREDLLDSLSRDKAICPRCGLETRPVKTWKMAGRPSKTGERLQLTIGYYKCPKCSKTFRKALAKEKIRA
jgi:hypothetical protein